MEKFCCDFKCVNLISTLGVDLPVLFLVCVFIFNNTPFSRHCMWTYLGVYLYTCLWTMSL